MIYAKRKIGPAAFEAVPIKPLRYFIFYGYRFVVHRSLKWFDGTAGGVPAYTATELSSGFWVSVGDSVADTIKGAKKKLRKAGREKVEELKNDVIKKYGRAN